jgi:hypothetical protein
MAKGASKSVVEMLECREGVGEYRRTGGRHRGGTPLGTGDPGEATPPAPLTGLAESPVPGNRHAGFGRRLGETHRSKYRQGAPSRPHTFMLAAFGAAEPLAWLRTVSRRWRACSPVTGDAGGHRRCERFSQLKVWSDRGGTR